MAFKVTARIPVELTRDELHGLKGCIIEALNAIDDPDFSTRVGLERWEAEQLIETLNRALVEAGEPNE